MKITRTIFWILLLLAVLLGTVALAPAPRPATDAYTLIAEVNALRTSNGLAPYTINATLMAVAQAHSDYQAQTRTVTHYSADGSRPYQRGLAAGYPVGGNLSLGGFFSENIVAGNGMTPAQAVQIWQGDAPHLNTMLSPYLTEVGAGVTNVNGYIYYTLDASTPSGTTVLYTPDPNATSDGTEAGTGGALPTLDWIMPVITSTPNTDGRVVHEVQVGQSLWMIADIYGTTVQEIRALNGMSADELVYPGEKLLIRSVPTPLPSTPTLAPTSTLPPPTPFLTETSVPTSVAAQPSITPTLISAPEPVSIDPSILTVLTIIIVALAMAGLVTWLSGRDRD